MKYLRQRLSIILLFLLIISLVANILLYRLTNEYYRTIQVVALNPIGLGDYPSDPLPHTTAQRVIFFGDSRAAQWPAPTIPGFEFINRGIGAQTSAQVLARYDAHIAPLKPDLLIIEVGINDLKAIPLLPSERNTIVTACEANIKAMVVRATNQGAKVLIVTIFPPGEVPLDRRLVWSDAINQSIRDVNQYLITLQSESVQILDATPILADSHGIVQPAYRADTLHLTQAGYAVLNHELVPVIQEMLKH